MAAFSLNQMYTNPFILASTVLPPLFIGFLGLVVVLVSDARPPLAQFATDRHIELDLFVLVVLGLRVIIGLAYLAWPRELRVRVDKELGAYTTVRQRDDQTAPQSSHPSTPADVQPITQGAADVPAAADATAKAEGEQSEARAAWASEDLVAAGDKANTEEAEVFQQDYLAEAPDPAAQGPKRSDGPHDRSDEVPRLVNSSGMSPGEVW